MTSPYRSRFLVTRRLVQIAVMLLLAGSNIGGWYWLRGTLSHTILFQTVPLADPLATLQLLLAGGLLAVDTLLGAGIVLLFYGLLGGRVFCSWVCPMNPVTDLANWLSVKLKLQPEGRGNIVSRTTRYYALGLTFVLSFLLGTAAFEVISPIGMLHRGIIFGVGAGWFAVLAVFLFDLAVQRNGFCGHLCPLGAFYAAVSRVSLVRIHHEHEKCSSCMECVRVCPENQVLQLVGKASGSILDGTCTNCGRCIEVCEDDALRFGIRKRAIS